MPGPEPIKLYTMRKDVPHCCSCVNAKGEQHFWRITWRSASSNPSCDWDKHPHKEKCVFGNSPPTRRWIFRGFPKEKFGKETSFDTTDKWVDKPCSELLDEAQDLRNKIHQHNAKKKEWEMLIGKLEGQLQEAQASTSADPAIAGLDDLMKRKDAQTLRKRLAQMIKELADIDRVEERVDRMRSLRDELVTNAENADLTRGPPDEVVLATCLDGWAKQNVDKKKVDMVLLPEVDTSSIESDLAAAKRALAAFEKRNFKEIYDWAPDDPGKYNFKRMQQLDPVSSASRGISLARFGIDKERLERFSALGFQGGQNIID